MAFTYKLSYASRSRYIHPKSVGKIVVAQEDGEAFFREKLSGNLEVSGEDFQFLMDAEKFSVNCCQEILLSIYQRCNTGSEKLFWEGTFSLFNISWNFDNQTAVIENVAVKDAYSEILRNWHKEVNLLNFGERVKVYFDVNIPTDPEYNPSMSEVYDRGFDFIDAIRYIYRTTFKLNSRSPQPSREQFSNFFMDPVNPVTGKANFLNGIVIMHLSDAKRPGATNPAKKQNVSLKEILNAIKQTFKAFWYIDSATGFIRIEHISFFPHLSYRTAPVTLDLTDAKFKDSIKGKNGYSHDTGNIFAIEGSGLSLNKSVLEQDSQYKTPQYNPDPEVSSAYFQYANECVPLDSKGEKTESVVVNSLFATDIVTCRVHPADISDSGWALIDTTVINDVRVVRSEILPVSSILVPNGNLSTTRLFKDFHRFDASFDYGSLSGEKDAEGRQLRSKTVKNSKQFPVITLANCCDNNYDFSGFIKYPHADRAAVQRLEFDLITQSIELSLMAPKICNNIPIPDIDDEQDPVLNCPAYGTRLRIEEEAVLCADGITEERVNLWEVYADGQCSEYRVGGVVRYLNDCSVLVQ